jgi:hypothetical protein
MPRAFVLTSASKAGTTGGTFADALVANTGDSLAVVNFQNGGGKITEMWAIDSTSAAELSFVYSRPLATHDQVRGVRANIASAFPAAAGSNAGHNILAGYGTIDVYPSDVATVNVSTTAADNFLCSWVTLYDDMPGVSGVFITPSQCAAMQKSAVGIACNAVASGTRGAYGATRAFNTDDDRLHANTWYALLGWTLQTPVTTVSLLGPDWGGQRIGGPGGVGNLDNATWFWDQAFKWGNLPMIPCLNSNNKAAINVQIADGQASTSPKIDFLLYELNGTPVGGT